MIDFIDRVKGNVAQGLAIALLESAYRVTRLGLEERIAEIKLLDIDQYTQLNIPKQLRSMPDLLVTDPDMTKAFMVEVKFRKRLDHDIATELHRSLSAQMEMWPGTIAMLFLGDSFWPDRSYIQNHLRIVTREKLHVLTDLSEPPIERWQKLDMVHTVFPELEAAGYHDRADRIAGTIARLAQV